MDDGRFWSMIESAWDAVGGQSKNRAKLAKGELHDTAADGLLEATTEALRVLRDELDKLPAEELLGFDRVLERKLYDLDREDIQVHTDNSDDGFLYSRGFIVAAGRAYYEAVLENPSMAMLDMECEDLCCLTIMMYEEKFGPIPPSGISRETGSNKAGWPDL